MSDRDLPTTEMLGKLADGWNPSHTELARELARRWERCLRARVDIREPAVNTLTFDTEVSSIRLRSMDRLRCVLLGGKGALEGKPREVWKTLDAPGRVAVVLTASEDAYEQASEHLPASRCLILSPTRLAELLDAPDATRLLCESLWEQIPRRRLIPFNILRPADTTTFFGRRNELDRLRDEEDVSFAVAGPGRIGKTSLVLQYRRETRGSGEGRTHRIYYVNFYTCEDRSNDGVARFLATAIENSSRSARVTAGGLVNTLRYQSHLHEGPLDLLLDEVDEICHTETFQYLGEAARQGLCRVVMCGRGVLLNAVLDKRSPLACRLELLRLEPLDLVSAHCLLLDPLHDLGFTVAQEDQVLREIFHLTGRLPHLVQFFGKKLAELAIAENTEVITLEHVRALQDDFETAQYVTRSLLDLEDSNTQLLALALLRNPTARYSINSLIRIAEKEGLPLTHADALHICNDLVINNVLAWEKGGYQIATGALVHYAQAMGFLNQGLDRALEEIQTLDSGAPYQSEEEDGSHRL
jgi:hypothetical protein